MSRESFELAYRNIGTFLHLPGITDDSVDVKQLVKKTLDSASSGNWLMIVDNADDASVLLGGSDSDLRSSRLYDYLPRSERGKIIFTTRSRKAAEDLTQSNVIKLNDMERTEARGLVAKRLSEKALLNEEAAIDELLGLLAYLPLAIVQATAFINSNDASVAEYISLFRQPSREIQLFSEHFEDPSRYRDMESTIAKTWHISFDQILKQDRLAADYLSFMSCIDRVNIPQSLLPPGDPLQQVKAIGTLKGYEFISESQRVPHRPLGEKFFNLHRLVQMASTSWLKEHGEWTTWTCKAEARLQYLIPFGGYKGKEVWTTYIPHAIHVAALGGALDDTTKASILDRVGRCEDNLGQYSAAVTTYRQVLMIREKSLGEEHPSTLMAMNCLAGVLKRQGKYEEAESIYRQTLATREKVLGKEHPDTLTTMDNFAGLLHSQGKHEEAEPMHRQTLATSEKVLGKEHPDTLTTMNNLAEALHSKGKYKEAEVMHRQTLETRDKVLGKEHPDTLMTMNNLAEILHSQGKYKEAESIYGQTLATSEKVLGKEHPDTLTSTNNLAGVLDSQGKYEEAELIYRQTLVTREKVLGKEHPNTLTTMNNLAGVLDNQGRYEEAEPMYRQTIAISEKVLRNGHPNTLATINNLALMLDHCGKYEEAESMYRQTLAMREKVLGKEHPNTLTTMHNLAWVLDRQGKYEDAEPICRQTLAMREKVLGKEHPNTLTTMHNLAGVLESQGKYEESEPTYRQTLAMREKVLGKEYPNTLTTMHNLAWVLESQGKYEESEPIYRQTLATREKVLGKEHPNTLMNVYCLAHLLAIQHCYDESAILYKRACAGFSAIYGSDDPITRACCEQYSEMLVSQEQDPSTLPPKMPQRQDGGKLGRTSNNKPNIRTGKASIFSRGLVKMGIRRSKVYK
jgi:tetratricopeptide (TPR) repeat protein